MIAPQTGDIILFKGDGVFSTLIMASPGADYSHVGVFVRHPVYGPCLFESTSLGTLPDLITGKKINGVQLVPFEQRVNSYDGEVFHLPILGERTPEMESAGLAFIDKYHGTPYERSKWELANAQIDIDWSLPLLCRIGEIIKAHGQNKPDDSSLFCSETVVMYERAIWFIVDDGESPNESTPTDCRSLPMMPGVTCGNLYQL